MAWRPNKKKRASNLFSPIGKIGIDDFNANGKGLGKGSHQEVSFSVLHAKSNAADPASSSSPNTVTRPAWDLPPSEVENKKRQRKRSKRLAITAVAAIAVAAAVIICTLAILNYQHSLDYVGRMEECLRQVLEESEELKPLEDLMSNMLSKPLDAESAQEATSQWEGIQQNLEPAQDDLAKIKTQIEELQPHLTPANVEVCNQALSAINAELNVIDLSQNIMEDYVLSAAKAYGDSSAFMNQLLEADSLAREASQLMAYPTIDNAKESIDDSNASLDLFKAAKQNLENVQSVCENMVENTQPSDNSELKSKVPPTVNETGLTLLNMLFSPYLEYLDLRIQAQEQAIAGDNAYIDRDKNTVIATTDAYNALEIRAASTISQISTEPTQIVQATYDDRCLADSETFSSERSRLEVAVTAICNYLG